MIEKLSNNNHSVYYSKGYTSEITGALIHIPKTGGTCANNYLKEVAAIFFGIHYSALFVKCLLGENWNKLFVFSFVRNPWDRLVSLWLFHKRHNNIKNVSFGNYVKRKDVFINGYSQDLKEKDTLSQKPFLCNDNDKLLVDYVGKVEKFDSDLNYIHEQLGLKRPKKYIKINSHFKYRQGNDYTKFYNKETKEIVAKRCEWDIDTFKYSFGGLR